MSFFGKILEKLGLKKPKLPPVPQARLPRCAVPRHPAPFRLSCHRHRHADRRG